MPKIYIINTNQTNNPNCEHDMIKKEKCAAYSSPWKYYIDEIEANDIVFLFSNGNGIIARGIATGVSEVSDYEGKTDEEHYMHLNRFQMLSKPLLPSSIEKIVKSQMVLILPYRYGIKLWQKITKDCI